MKKLSLHSEICYLISLVILSLAVAMLSAADFGLSPIVVPAYLLSKASGVLTFGQAEYIIQAFLFIVFCLVVRKFKFIYLVSFLTCLIYGAFLDLWRMIPFFNPAVTSPESIQLYIRIIMFIVGELLTAFSIALCFKAYFYPQVYDFFVKGVAERYKLKRSLFKIIFDISMLAIGLVMTFSIFGRLVGIGVGTFVIAVSCGFIIGLFGKMLDNCFEEKRLFPKLADKFDFFC